MNVAQELSDRELYDYDVLVKLLGDRFDPASRVSASRSRFMAGHDATKRTQTPTPIPSRSCAAWAIHQSSPELRQELISKQFVRGQSDPELKKYLWVVIRTQKDRKLQTLIEVCTRFRRPQSYNERSPTGGAGVRGGGGRRPGRGDVRRGGLTAVEHTEGGGTTSVPRATADVYPRVSHGL